MWVIKGNGCFVGGFDKHNVFNIQHCNIKTKNIKDELFGSGRGYIINLCSPSETCLLFKGKITNWTPFHELTNSLQYSDNSTSSGLAPALCAKVGDSKLRAASLRIFVCKKAIRCSESEKCSLAKIWRNFVPNAGD